MSGPWPSPPAPPSTTQRDAPTPSACEDDERRHTHQQTHTHTHTSLWESVAVKNGGGSFYTHTIKTWTCGAKPLKCGVGFKITRGRHLWKKIYWINQISRSVSAAADCHLYTKCIVAVRLAHSDKVKHLPTGLFFNGPFLPCCCEQTLQTHTHSQSKRTFALSNTHSTLMLAY